MSMNAEKSWKIAGIVAAVCMVATAGFHFLAPMPSAANETKRHHATEVKLKEETARLMAQISSDRAFVESAFFDAIPEQLGSEVMGKIDALSQKFNVKVQALRPQRVVSSHGIQKYPYSVVVQGAFPKVAAFLNQIQNKETKLALNSVQITSADGETDNVTATIGIAAFLDGGVVGKDGS